MTPEIWIPRTARPKWKCNLCNAEFTEDEDQQRIRHLKACVKRNKDEIDQAAEALSHDPLLDCQDPEFAEWTKRVNGDFHLR